MSVEAKAQELAAAMKETEEYENYSSAQTRVKLDPAAQDILEQLQQAQQEVRQLQSQGQSPSQNQINEFQVLEQRAQSNLTLQNLLKSQEAFGEVMNTVNETLSKELFGETGA